MEIKLRLEPSLARSAMARILIIDDDEMVRKATTIMLEAGHRASTRSRPAGSMS
jgi:DNA-binding NtrC family response regulator